MSSFIKFYRTVTSCSVIFNHQQKSGYIISWIHSQTFQKGSNLRLVSKDVTWSNVIDTKAVVSPLIKTRSPQFSTTKIWSDKKYKDMKCEGDRASSKNRKHKHKKKKSKRKSKDKLKQIMAASKSAINEDESSSDSDILVVFEAKKASPNLRRNQVEEILLDDDSQSSPINPISLKDIPLPEEGCDVQDLASIPLPKEGNSSKNVQGHPSSFMKVQEHVESHVNDKGRRIDIGEFITRELINESVYLDCKDVLKNLSAYETKVRQEKSRMHSLRTWENTDLGHTYGPSGVENDGIAFTIMSYNVLAQQLLEDHRSLYNDHDVRTLTWDHRSRTLLNEFRAANADVLCLQEVQFDHLEWFNDRLTELGYTGLFKKRTYNHVDGCAIYFKRDRFHILESSSVEYYQPGVQVLDRHNVGLIVRLEVVGSDQQLVVATTHLLFNPRRHDVKLAQTQLLLTELERVSYLKFDERSQKAVYRPVIITGDFNLQPDSAVYKFITEGFIDYSVLSARSLAPAYFGPVQSSLLPPDLEVSNSCQHVGIIQNRQGWRRDTEQDLLKELRLLKPHNSDNDSFLKEKDPHQESLLFGTRQEGFVNKFVPNWRAEATSSDNYLDVDKTRPGTLCHNFNLKSVYRHYKRDPSSSRPLREATTHQDYWVTVDYMFYSGIWSDTRKSRLEGPLKLLSRLRLPSVQECQQQLGRIPNTACGSDHLPLLARFLLRS